jgi:hypothetical protein
VHANLSPPSDEQKKIQALEAKVRVMERFIDELISWKRYTDGWLPGWADGVNGDLNTLLPGRDGGSDEGDSSE